MNPSFVRSWVLIFAFQILVHFSAATRAQMGAIGIANYAGITVTNEVGKRVRVDYSESLSQENAVWQELETITMDQPEQVIFDTDSPKRPHRFYRAVELGLLVNETLNLASGAGPVQITLSGDGTFAGVANGTNALSGAYTLDETVGGELMLHLSAPGVTNAGLITLAFSTNSTTGGTFNGTIMIDGVSAALSGTFTITNSMGGTVGLAGKAVTLITADGTTEQLTLSTNGTFQSDIHASGTYTVKPVSGGVQLDLNYNSPLNYGQDHYELVLIYNATAGTGTFSGNLFFSGSNHSVSGTVMIQ